MANTNTNFQKHPEYKKQMKHLADLITKDQTGKGKFSVIGVEAGVGKSRETDKAIARYLNNVMEWDRKFLIVKRFQEDVYESAARINRLCKNHHVAIGITQDEWRQFLKGQDFSRIEMYQVVIITHVRYRSLSQQSQEYFRAFFEKGRHTLIIDEQLEVPVLSYNDRTFGNILSCLNYEFKDMLDELCKPLQNELKRLKQDAKSNYLHMAFPIVENRLIREFEEFINAHYFLNDNHKNEVRTFIDFLYNLETVTCLYNPAFNGIGARISSLCLGLDRWTLQNNIILDASAGLDKRYDYSNDMKTDIQPNFVDHYNFTFNHVRFNSSRANKSKTEDFYPKITALIREKCNAGDKVLVVTHENDEKTVIQHLQAQGYKFGSDRMGRDIAVAHFGEIIGKNRWKDFNQVWIIASPNIPVEVYPLYWCFFAQQPITDENLYLKRTDGKFGFTEQKFEDIRIGCLVSDIYQAIKRIDREVKRQSQINIVASDDEVVTQVKNQLQNVNVGWTIELDVKYKEGKKKNEPGRRGRRSNRIDEMKNLLLYELEPGEHQKKDLYDRLGWKSNGKTGSIWTKPEITKLDTQEIIKISKHTIVKQAINTLISA